VKSYTKFLIIFVLPTLFLFYFLHLHPNPTEYKVVRVIDGDTIELEDGTKVRLLEIDAPEKGERCYEEAKTRLEELVLNKKVRLEKDKEDKDRYGRLLRYVFIDCSLINLVLVKEGLAYSYIIEPNVKYMDKILDAEKFAKEFKIGCLWK